MGGDTPAKPGRSWGSEPHCSLGTPLCKGRGRQLKAGVSLAAAKSSEEASSPEWNEGRHVGNRLKGAKVGATLCKYFPKFSSKASILNLNFQSI